jgi:hypothetical protein
MALSEEASMGGNQGLAPEGPDKHPGGSCGPGEQHGSSETTTS